jgi:hypothetical protein
VCCDPREDELDTIIRPQLLKFASANDSAPDVAALVAAAHRLDNLIHHRRTVLAGKASSHGKAESQQVLTALS